MASTPPVDSFGRTPAEQVDELLNRLDIEDGDAVRADLIDALIGLADQYPEVAGRVREGGVPA